MNIYVLILIIVVFIILGIVLYKVQEYEFTPNAKFILNLLFNELDLVNSKLKYSEVSNYERLALVDRKNEIEYTLSQFFGKKLV